MIIEMSTTKQVNAKYLKIDIPIRYGDEDMPYDFPLRENDNWVATVDLDTSKIENWPQGKSGSFCTKVCDEGTYSLLDGDKEVIAKIDQNYVPNDVVPGEYGDYIDLKIDENGIITNMPEKLNFEVFFRSDD
ncbi:hypothetical protein [Rodentibacter pneumotropicus]|uniref:hypothetical protein n=1 Tax=Rodentibacter pneumotropicus TaxID=758 RepID=UPI00109D6BF5|nr:hypothetical protein [Rodentibacter pneumotropicus]THA09436.1 hypothetical protein D3M77_02180 [Rodentibacter pneumotropicus]